MGRKEFGVSVILRNYTTTNMTSTLTCICHYCSEAVLTDIGEKLKSLQIDKDKIGWDLVALEESVQAQIDRECDSDDESDSE